jgi:hypothetical protein
MEKMQFQGFWREFNSNKELPSIFEDVQSSYDYSEKEKVISYLNNGKFILGTRHFVFCPITQEKIGSPEVYTDGNWAWTSMLIYYVKKYSIKINEDFLKAMEMQNFLCPQPSMLKEEERALVYEIDYLCD